MSSIFGRAIIVPKTNKSGGALAKGDVVIVDSANDNAVTTTTSAGTTVTVGVVVEENGIANNASGRVQFGGHVGLVTVNASVTRGHYGTTHTVAKQATDGGASRVVGSFCLFTTGGTTPEADLFTQPDASSATGDVATDAIWDAAGDLAVGTGPNAAAKVSLAQGHVSRVGGVLGYDSGSSFPGSPSSGDRYWRTDLGMEFYYDGTRWLSTTLYHSHTVQENISAGSSYAAPNITLSTFNWPTPAIGSGSDVWLVAAEFDFFVNGGTALSGSHSWVTVLGKTIGANTQTTVLTFTANSGASSVWRRDTQAIGALLNNGTTHYAFNLLSTKTGTPGPLFSHCDITFRIVAT